MENRLAILEGKGKIELISTNLDVEIGERDLLIKVSACNICTSEYGIYSGVRSAKFPYTIGHEWSGYVVKCGTGVRDFSVGDFVAGCYEYDAISDEAQTGNTSSSPRLYAFNEMNSNGYYGRFRACADYLVQPEISAFKMSSALDPSEAAFLEPLSTVVSGIKKMDLKITDSVLVIGAGTMGILNSLVAKRYGCTVVTTDFADKKVKTAASLGIKAVKLTSGTIAQHRERILAETGIEYFDKIIVAVGVTSAYEQAFEMLKKNDGLVLLFAAGFPEPKLSISANQIHYRKITIIGTYTANYSDFKDAAKLLSDGKVDVSLLVEERVPLEDIDYAMQKATVAGAYRISVICE